MRDFPTPSSQSQLQRFPGIVDFYGRFLLHCADTILPLASLLSYSKRSFEESADSLAAFDKVKAVLAENTLQTHFSPDAPISLMVSASDVVLGAVLQQLIAGHIQPSAFFSRKLSAAETHHSTFEREILAVFLAVKYSWHCLDGRSFTVFTHHKLLSFAPKSTSDKLNHQEVRQLDYISQFTSNIRHIEGSSNAVANAPSKPCIVHL
nr:unnamed protein product [Spirometra erinaceieuropaei]